MAADADRHLLFGLLALQNGLIDLGQLVAAFQDWIRDRARPLADHLISRGALDSDGRAAVEAMLAMHLKKHGDVEKSLGAMPIGRSTRERLAALGAPAIDGTLSRIGAHAAEAASTARRSWSIGAWRNRWDAPSQAAAKSAR
jgi:hypothetical protein